MLTRLATLFIYIIGPLALPTDGEPSGSMRMLPSSMAESSRSQKRFIMPPNDLRPAIIMTSVMTILMPIIMMRMVLRFRSGWNLHRNCFIILYYRFVRP